MSYIRKPAGGVNNRASILADVHKAAMQAHEAGLCIIPPAEDGTKRPLPISSGVWGKYKTTRPTTSGLGSWYPGRTGLGVVTGAVSGRTECWDFDDRPAYELFVAAAMGCGLGDVVARIEAGYCDDTPANGVRWLVRYPAEVERPPGKKIVLARRPKRPEEMKSEANKVKILIEMPAFSIVAPTNGTVHPSGKPYVRRNGDFVSIASYTAGERDALMEVARSFDAMPRIEAEPKPDKRAQGGTRPGDDFNAKAAWSDILPGWTNVRTRSDGTTEWRRPGKKLGISATTNFTGSDRLHVFTSSTEFEAEKSYTKFGAFAVLNYRGDFKAAARALAKEGYGSKQQTTPTPEDSTAEVVGEYRLTADGIQWLRHTKDGDFWLSLTNFRARIISDITQDDGVETTRALEIEAIINSRRHTFTVSAAQFSQMTWVLDQLGAEATVQPGQGSKDRARHAIQVLSGTIPQRRIYMHTGWRQVDDQRVYLHGGGALGSAGPVNGMEVQLPEQLDRYVLPAVVEDSLPDAVRASLAIRRVAPDRVTIPLLGAVYRAPIGGADFSVHISGRTGAQKTEITALAQQHYGAGMNARSLPGSWSSTGNALEAMASAAKDAVITIDDYVPQGTTADRARLNALADRVLRAQGNSSGRARLRSDATMRRARPPRGLIISTGEEVPGGQSLVARLVVTELKPGDVVLELLTLAQVSAAQGDYAHALAGFIMWLASRLDDVRVELVNLTHERRARVGVSHARTADVLAQISATWTIWLRFAVDIGAISSEEAAIVEEEVWATVTALAGEQQALQRANDPVHRFYELLRSVFTSGKAHIASAEHPDNRPADKDHALALGWRRSVRAGEIVWQPQGTCIGWWSSDGLYLSPEAAYAVVQQSAASGEPVGIASTSLWRRMHERNLLLSTERAGGELRLKCRKSIGGARQRVIHIAHLVTPHVPDSGPTGPAGPSDEIDKPDQEVA